jgi:hypothetical protein
VHGRGFDQLPAEVLEQFRGSMVRSLEREELARAFRAAVELLARELRHSDGALAERMEATVRMLAQS